MTPKYGYARAQKYSFNTKRKTFKHLFILSKLIWYNQNQWNTVNKQCSLDLDVAFCVYLDIWDQKSKIFQINIDIYK